MRVSQPKSGLTSFGEGKLRSKRMFNRLEKRRMARITFAMHSKYSKQRCKLKKIKSTSKSFRSVVSIEMNHVANSKVCAELERRHSHVDFITRCLLSHSLNDDTNTKHTHWPKRLARARDFSTFAAKTPH